MRSVCGLPGFYPSVPRPWPVENSWTSTHHWAGTLELLIRRAMVVDRCDDVGRRRYRNGLDVEHSSTMAELVAVVVIIGSAMLLLG